MGGGFALSFVPKLLQDLTTNYGRDIVSLDKSFVQSLSSGEDSNLKVLVSRLC